MLPGTFRHTCHVSAKAEWAAKKAAQAKQRKLENDLKKTETRIANEQKITDIRYAEASEEVCRNSAKLPNCAEQKTWQEELDHLYEEWEGCRKIVHKKSDRFLSIETIRIFVIIINPSAKCLAMAYLISFARIALMNPENLKR